MMLSLLRSLVLSTILSFSLPVLGLGGLFLALSLASHIPWVDSIGQMGRSQMIQFLTIFGDGYPVQGIIIIGFAFAVVGSLFDLFNFYVYQGTRGQ